MNSHMISQSQAEQREVEQTQEYQFEQRLLVLDEKLARLRATLERIHEDDKAFNRYLRKQNRNGVHCSQCGNRLR